MFIEVACSTKNGDHHFSKLFNVEETKDIIHSRIYPARNVVQSVSYNISALISSNFIIKNYVNRKITSYIYLLIFTISLWLHVKHFIALTKRESVRRIFFCCNYWSGLSLSTHRPMTKKTKACVCIKRVKTDSYLTYGHSRKTWNIRRYPHLQINSFVLWKCNMGWEY